MNRGATIHDVAQVAGAGYSVDDAAGDIAAFTKLLRVTPLPVVLLVVRLCYRSHAGGTLWSTCFVFAFMALMVLSNTVPLPETLIATVDDGSRLALSTAISALGVQTSLRQMLSSGSEGFLVIGLESLPLVMALMPNSLRFERVGMGRRERWS